MKGRYWGVRLLPQKKQSYKVRLQKCCYAMGFESEKRGACKQSYGGIICDLCSLTLTWFSNKSKLRLLAFSFQITLKKGMQNVYIGRESRYR